MCSLQLLLQLQAREEAGPKTPHHQQLSWLYDLPPPCAATCPAAIRRRRLTNSSLALADERFAPTVRHAPTLAQLQGEKRGGAQGGGRQPLCLEHALHACRHSGGGSGCTLWWVFAWPLWGVGRCFGLRQRFTRAGTVAAAVAAHFGNFRLVMSRAGLWCILLLLRMPACCL